MITDNGKCKIILIENAAELDALGRALMQKKIFSFDTEFDRFYREYGFKLSLLQIFDGENCYIIDPLAVKDLSPLWPPFENINIVKVVYSCSEDIQILKVNGCMPKNIYDLQIAAKLCNDPANSFSDLLLSSFNITADKTLQRSNWRKRPLHKEQLLYAANDVTPLITLKEKFDKIAEETGVAAFIAEENRACEDIPVSTFTVKLTAVQKKTFSLSDRELLFQLMLLRDDVAQHYNVPPANVCNDFVLEKMVTEKDPSNINESMRGLSKLLQSDHENLARFSELIKDYKFTTATHSAKIKVHTREFEKGLAYQKPQDIDADKYAILSEAITKQFGKTAGEFILRGYKKSYGSRTGPGSGLKSYQKEVIESTCKKLNLEF